jgi:ABC-type Fe2+-enterobactin transport system substrate-binding protein
MYRRLAIALLLPAIAAPAAASAKSDPALDACIQTFLMSDLAKNRAVTVQKTSYAAPRPIAFSGPAQVVVTATGRDSGKQLAQIVCSVDKKGNVVAVNGRPAAAIPMLASTR